MKILKILTFHLEISFGRDIIIAISHGVTTTVSSLRLLGELVEFLWRTILLTGAFQSENTVKTDNIMIVLLLIKYVSRNRIKTGLPGCQV